MRIVPIREDDEPQLSPDLVWDGVMGDFAIAEADEAGNRGGLRAKAQLETAVLICLMTDVRVDEAQKRLVDQLGGPQGLTRALPTHRPCGDAAQQGRSISDDRIELAGGRKAAEFPGDLVPAAAEHPGCVGMSFGEGFNSCKRIVE